MDQCQRNKIDKSKAEIKDTYYEQAKLSRNSNKLP